MVNHSSEEWATRVRDWCNHVAGLGVDALIDAGLIRKSQFEKASGIIAQELFVRLCLHDYPPAPD
jgi:hypothetical protein